jgi:hypothetical protein
MKYSGKPTNELISGVTIIAIMTGSLWRMIPVPRAIVAISCLLLTSCAELRLQTIRGTKTMWLSKNGDDASLGKLEILDKGRTTPVDDPQFVPLDHGAQVYVTDYSSKHCQGRNVFVKIQVKDGDHKGIEGWICGASTTHRKIAAL